MEQARRTSQRSIKPSAITAPETPLLQLGLVSMSGSITVRTRANEFLIIDDLVNYMEEMLALEHLDMMYINYASALIYCMIGDNDKKIYREDLEYQN